MLKFIQPDTVVTRTGWLTSEVVFHDIHNNISRISGLVTTEKVVSVEQLLQICFHNAGKVTKTIISVLSKHINLCFVV